MTSSVESVPNHYQTLGLSPTASQSEVATAFARAMSMYGARSLDAAAKIGAAFEVLRNPAKRRAYDGALGLRQEPYRWTSRAGAGFMGSAWGDLAGRVAADNPAPVPKPGLQSRLENGAEPKIASFIASSLRQPPVAVAASRPREPIAEAEEQGRQESSSRVMERHLADVLAASAVGRESDKGKIRAVEWKRPALALGALVLIAGFIGTVAGVWVQGSAKPAETAPQSRASVTVPLPKPAATAAVTPASVPIAPEAEPKPVPEALAAVATPQPPAPPVEAAVDNSSPIVPSPSAVQAASDELAAESASPAVAEAKMPLPNATIASTIDRIGYSCGNVASIAAMADAGAGVFKVTCSSGEDYRATPINGRYHFHKLGG